MAAPPTPLNQGPMNKSVSNPPGMAISVYRPIGVRIYMSTKTMLIDAAHPEETRVVVLDGHRLEDFDVESSARRQLKGNIYLAKVTRVEPSLQAAFVEYGGNRHGFLAFSEIHPDYFQIPVADRQALQAAEVDEEPDQDEDIEPEGENDGQHVETLGGTDVEEVAYRRRPSVNPRNYKIQEVIKRRQILLVQVVKEERGNKGAALTTYISLAGRYCVLMPNTPRGGGVSRKIANGADRNRLKTILGDLEIPNGMAVIVRTAGAKRSKSEIKRDHEYLTRLWDTIRRTTLESIAPTLVHEEANLIRRSIRDMYTRDMDNIIVEGDPGYRTAKGFMKLLIPSHAKKVQPYRDNAISLFHAHGVENQIDGIHNAEVQLKSGGYIVINPTEALVSVDVNSGKSTRERNIEETALRTNLEAADEIARQLRLKDLAGLIVIDFIDMEVNRNNAQVERRLKETMRQDRARIQIGRISPFGLLEMSRQRLRPSLIETSSAPCPYCGGTGNMRSIDSSALQILRRIEEEAYRRRAGKIVVYVSTAIALYVLNQKRESLANIEKRFYVEVTLESDDSLIPPGCRIEKLADYEGPEPTEKEKEQIAVLDRLGSTEDDQPKKRKRRRRRGRKGEEDRDNLAFDIDEGENDQGAANEVADDSADGNVDDSDDSEGDPRKEGRRRRRGRRGGRGRRRKDEGEEADNTVETAKGDVDPIAAEHQSTESESRRLLDEPDGKPAISPPDGTSGDATEVNAESENKPKRRRGRRSKVETNESAGEKEPSKRRRNREQSGDVAESATSDVVEIPITVVDGGQPSIDASENNTTDTTVSDASIAVPEPASVESGEDIAAKLAAAKTEVINLDEASETEKPKRGGWWRRA